MCNRSDLYCLLVTDLWDCLPADCRDFSLNSSDVVGRDILSTCSNERSVAALQLTRSIFKKFKDEIDQEAADKAAYEVFLEMNNRCKNWEFDDGLLGPYDELVVGEFKKALWEFFNPGGFPLFSQYGIEQGVDFGPGSAPGAERETFLHKLGHSRLSATSPLVINLFDQWCKSHPSRLDAELARTLLYGSPQVIPAVKMTAVPKTAKISRLVKPEPLLNMFFQKGMQALLEDRLRTYFGIDLARQPRHNAELARIGSLSGDFATIDLKSASDCLSLKLLEKFVDPQNNAWINLFRSGKVIIPAEGGDEVIDLHMVATMGNAFCFPLQTAIYASAVQAVYRALGIRHLTAASCLQTLHKVGEKFFLTRSVEPHNWGVFGDDIIVVEEALDCLYRLLGYLGFIVNKDKSFRGRFEPFRESCGADFWNGVNVRGVYCKSLLMKQDRYSLINNLVAWSIRHGISLKNTIRYLLQSVNRKLQVPPWENPDSGIRVPYKCITSPFVKRLGKRVEGNGPDFAGSLLYRKWQAIPAREDVESDEFSNSKLGRNSAAKLIAASRGHLRGGYLTFRIFGQTLYGTRMGVAPSWDYIPSWSDLYDIRDRWFTESEVYF